jgi:hypothetical protein
MTPRHLRGIFPNNYYARPAYITWSTAIERLSLPIVVPRLCGLLTASRCDDKPLILLVGRLATEFSV